METSVGHVTHYFNRIRVAVVVTRQAIKINDILHFIGHKNDFYQKVWSMEIDHRPIQSAARGAEIAIQVAEPVHKGDQVFLVKAPTPEEGEGILSDQLREWEEKKV